MQLHFILKRTTTADKDFRYLVSCLDHELWVELKEDQATYDQYNKVPDIETAIVIYAGEEPIACGCFKVYDQETVEIKRMFVQKAWRGKGLSRKLLNELKQWAIELGYRYAVLETSHRFVTARQLYTTNNYQIIPNYPPYTGMEESVCMKKKL
jgi:GNAT superfamily N-acetyltransferase